VGWNYDQNQAANTRPIRVNFVHIKSKVGKQTKNKTRRENTAILANWQRHERHRVSNDKSELVGFISLAILFSSLHQGPHHPPISLSLSPSLTRTHREKKHMVFSLMALTFHLYIYIYIYMNLSWTESWWAVLCTRSRLQIFYY
jgi:hypothetical protein